jgi:glycine/D-amino acid oxidase-like deaminating enzyme
MKLDEILAPGAKFEPYWWDAAPRPTLPETDAPARVDVAVVGSGFTGLVAALTLARAGRSVAVFDAEAAGWGASSRAQGHIGLIKRPFGDLEAQWGRARAIALIREGQAAIAFAKDLAVSEKIDCHLSTRGRFIAAGTPGHYESLAREVEVLKREIGFNADMVTRAEQNREIGSDLYHGGEVRHDEAFLHTAMFHQGLLDRARQAGGMIVPHTRARRIERDGKRFRVSTTRGKTDAGEVLMATNAYTDGAAPELRRRVIPIGAYGAATEPLPPGVLGALIPAGRAGVDTWKMAHSFRPAPDGSRLIFGGRVSMTETDPKRSAPKLYRFLMQLFPQLKGVKLSHAWTGKVAYTFQTAPHLGVRDGVHYAMGFCGYGVALGPYLGFKAAGKILRRNDAHSPFEDLPFETRPFYYGYPWFLAATVAWYRYLDWRAK